MSIEVLLAFVAACVVLALTPGPNMSLIVANTTAHGLAAGLWTLAGAALGLALLVTATALGMSSLMVFMSEWFDVIRWCGALYLVWLGVRQLYRVWKGGAEPAAQPLRGGNRFMQGLIVSLSNPKVLLFLGAFFPQFVDPARDPLPQLTTLTVLFVIVLTAVDVLYTVAIGRARRRFTARHTRAMETTAGVLLLAGGAVLAAARRP